ncbi:PREDICTED: agamous-like MADS-box protein AGL103 [Camelina sativa]|uniref:Agamous-like MADS-box protein AGL103 n=1 Tax=Camelina sativa TaxID=90675 RepID=A0ABM0XLP7_CAMSA|nr:PREDICTED: agamous-like MADS-box protein AGL103 [Camelina sativa]
MVSFSSCSLSTSSSTKKNSMRFPQIQQTVFKKPYSASSSARATSLIKRRETVFKKANELSILCGIDVCVIYYGPDGELKTWPKEREKVTALALRYGALSERKRRKGRVDLYEFLDKINKDDSKKKDKKKQKKEKPVRRVAKVKYPVWDPRFDNYSAEQLSGLVQSLERNLTRIQQRVRAVVEGHGQRKIQYLNMASQGPMMPSTMNQYFQQQPNQHVSMFLYNHGNGNVSQIPVSASALNQGQSLAPVPPELLIYPNQDVGNYSGSFGAQGTGINGSQNMNMLTYNNINSFNGFSKQIDQNSRVGSYSSLLEDGIDEFEDSRNNFNAEDYSGFLGAQGTVTNGMQNMNMHDNNNNSVNANGHSHQFGQFQTQQQHGAFNWDQPGSNFRSLYDLPQPLQ